METFGIYSLKAGIILVLFWGIYRLFLQKETFFRFNRFFLLAGLIVSLLLSLYTIHYTVEVKAPEIPIHIISETESASQPTTSTGTTDFSTLIKKCILFLPALYVGVMIILLIVRIASFSRILRIISRSKHKRYANYTLIESSEFDGAFSFFNLIVIPENLNEFEKSIILRHEETHIVQKHWVDLLITNILSLIWWFNPICWLYESAIKTNHEYLSDKEVLTLHKQADYQQTLVNQWFKNPIFPIANSFSYSNRLKRIKMMKKGISSPSKRLFSLAAIPALAIFLCAFAEKEYIYSPPEKTTVKKIQEGKIHEDNSMSMFNGEFTVKIDSTGFSLEGCEEQPLIVIDNRPTDMNIKDVVFEEINSTKTIASEDAIKHYGEKGKNGAVILTTKTYAKKSSQDKEKISADITSAKANLREVARVNVTNPDTINNDKVSHSRIIQINSTHPPFNSDNLKTELPDTESYNFDVLAKISYTTPEWKVFNYGGKMTFRKKTIGEPLKIIDGKKESIDISDINPENIHSISIYKDSAAIEKYGEDAKDGVILITTKEGRKAQMESFAYDIKGTVTDEFGNPIGGALVKTTETETETYTDQNGLFTLLIAPGDWIIVETEGYEKKLYQTDESVKITSAQITLKKKL